MPLGQYTPGQALVEAPTVFDTFTTFNRGVKAGTGFGAPTIAAGAGAGAGTLSSIRGTDFAGNFVINVAAAGSGAGTLATVTFANQLAVAPSSVVVSASDNTGTAALAAGAQTLAATGFAIVTAAPVAVHFYTVSYTVIQ